LEFQELRPNLEIPPKAGRKMGDSHRAVFYDASGRRRRHFRTAVIGVMLALLIAAVFFLVSLRTDPKFPALLLPPAERLADFSEVPEITRGETLDKNTPYRAEDDEAYPDVKPGQVRLATGNQSAPPLVFGFYVNWDPTSLGSLSTNIGHLTHLVPEWLYLQNGAGDVAEETDENVIRLAKGAHVPILVLVTNYRNGWKPGELHEVLRRPRVRHRLESNIRDRVVAHDFAGVNINFEGVQSKDRNLLTTFIQELRSLLHSQGLLLTEDVPTDDDGTAYDLKRLAELNDYIVPMVYDQHFQSGRPGPIAAQRWFTYKLSEALAMLPPAKTVIGIGNYGYDWIIGSRGGVEVRFGDVMSAAIAANAPIQWDRVAHNPVLRYERAGLRHEVWYLDGVTALNELQAVSHQGVRGAALWRLGSEDPGFWKVLAHGVWASEDYQPEQLTQLDAQQSVLKYGRGEFIRLADIPRVGHREVWRATKGYSEQYQSYPSSYILDSHGYTGDNRIALTFDDGPDSTFTPQVLDILNAKRVPAAFFVIGSHVEDSVGLLKRMYAEGHTIGNHTYSHPNRNSTSDTRTRLELSLTQRLIEYALARSSTLFRPPYKADGAIRTLADLAPLKRAQGDGYIMVGAEIDPRDWETRSSAQIAQAVLRDKDLGNIIVLHDGGGDRSATVAALPRIIDTLRAQGYRFVGVGDLLGKTRDELMPVPPPHELRWAKIEGSLLVGKSKLRALIGVLLTVAICLALIRTLVYGVLSILQKRRASGWRFDPRFAPPVSLIIAAYDEEKVIAQSIRSILDNGYKAQFEVIAVDDGSHDATLEVLRKTFSDETRVRILTQPNGGKATALNRAIANAQNEVLIALDADTILAQGTMAKLVRHFADPRVAAVSGNVRVGNEGKWITRFQSLEYICGFNLDRRALDFLNAVSVIPGAAGAWRKSVVLQCGGFSNDTVAEDTDLTLAIRRKGFILRYDEEAKAYTKVPETIGDLVRQRLRWAFGTLQAAWKHRDATFDPKYGTMAFVTLPSIWLYQVMFSAVSPIAEVAILVAILEGNGKTILVYYLAFLLLELLVGILAYSLENDTSWNLGLLPFQRVFYPHLMLYVISKSIASAIAGKLQGWGKASRGATVQEAPKPAEAMTWPLRSAVKPGALEVID
jgi:cellulose synthase/poly-beta-1,6-N-acetylglucosamine synthase-like glycosyltransferase/spore germination protein YaaH/peptidoglycan/xylan/chitin deacetylase (PgdA/CDA1 family)